MTIATVLVVLSIAIYFASNTAFNMLILSNSYTAATTEAEKSMVLAAGQATLAIYEGTAFNASYSISTIALLIISVVMLRSSMFSKQTAVTGILMCVCMIVPPTAGKIGIMLSLLSLVPTAVWLILIARAFFQMGSQPGGGVKGKLQEIR